VTATILVPVKDQENAKTRMQQFLSSDQRAALAWAMFMDLGRALEAVPAPVVLVSNSEKACTFALRKNWRVLRERAQISESHSIDYASAILAAEGCRSVLRLPADLPLIQSRDVEDLLARVGGAKAAAIVPSHDRLGTNALLRTPPDLFPSRFGRNSLVLHIQEALRAGVRLEIVENPRLGLDLDDGDDVARFLANASDTETFRMLSSIDLRGRD
jgi:2-phospho-L-lactate/phosphoenolpyruvate guanylyltransferase